VLAGACITLALLMLVEGLLLVSWPERMRNRLLVLATQYGEERLKRRGIWYVLAGLGFLCLSMLG
jgi:uncharacterized protein YjeT (DUF2065 family)